MCPQSTTPPPTLLLPSLKKKSLFAAERSETDRAAWRDLIGYLPVNDLVFVDECGSYIALTPLSARAPRGQRAYRAAPRNWGKNTTLIAGLSLSGIQAPMILEGAVDTLAFEVYVEQVLVPSLKPGQVVVLDNLSVHKGERVRQAIEAKGCQVLFLPAYSPDFAPIEEAFSKLKTWLRRLSARTREALEEAIALALSQITAQDARGWFWHCGYLPSKPGKRNREKVPA
jgi:transposase